MKVLIVEDEVNTLRSYKIYLEARGHQVVTAEDSETCLKLYFKANKKTGSKKSSNSILPYDVVIIDYRIPKKDGMEVAKEILNANSDQRIIFASAYIKEILEKEIHELKGYNINNIENMQKPFNLDKLANKIEYKGEQKTK